VPDGERVTTGSEPRRTFTLKRMGYSPNACFIREGADQLHPGEAVRVVEVVEPGHDEQTETHAAAYSEGYGDAVAAVVEALRADDVPTAFKGAFGNAADWIENHPRFGSSVSGGE
jgi:hypothetical protein